MHFVVSTINKLTGKVLYEMTAHPEYVYHRRDYEHCSGVIFKIATVNQVGRGEFSEEFKSGFAGRTVIVNTSICQKHVNFSLFPSIWCLA